MGGQGSRPANTLFCLSTFHLLCIGGPVLLLQDLDTERPCCGKRGTTGQRLSPNAGHWCNCAYLGMVLRCDGPAHNIVF